MNYEKQREAISASCELLYNTFINNEIIRLDFVWPGPAPGAGQFFMVKPKRSSVFLPRPISLANWQPASKDDNYNYRRIKKEETPFLRYLRGKFLESNTVSFLIARKGKMTNEMAAMQSGEEAELTGPLGNTWMNFLPRKRIPDSKLIALVSGGIGIAPLNALLCEKPEYGFVMHAGFRKGFRNYEEKAAFLGAAAYGAANFVIATENGKDVKKEEAKHKGLITDFLEPEQYAAVCACGPEAMLRAAAEKCAARGVPCYVSLERHMACGVGACLGCTVATTKGNRRCCADGPIFPAEELFF
jgi:NAD(P)H-flavin reductase